MTLRKVEKEALATVWALDKACFADAWTEEMWTSAFARTDFFAYVLETEKGAQGFVCGTALFEESELLKIAVCKDSRGNGYGGALLDAFLSETRLRGAERTFLEVREGNIPARRLYESRAFTQTRVRKQYYPDGENAVEMVKTLDGSK